MVEKRDRNQFGSLKPKYNFSMNPYPEFRFSKCPDCQNKTGQRKLPLIIHIDPKNLIALNYTCRYCKQCDMHIAHKHEVEHHLTELFQKMDKDVIGNNYLVFGTVEKKAWHENIKHPKSFDEMRRNIHDFISYQTIQMTMAGWFQKEIPCPQPGENFYGQDGNYIINPPSYTKLDEKGNPLPDDASSWAMVKDNVAGLIWENKTNDDSINDKDNTYNWQDAQDVFIKSLNQNAFGDSNHWRLPTMEELASIVNLNRDYPSIDTFWFSYTMSKFYWTFTSNALSNGNAWGVNFNYGDDYTYDKSSAYYVRAVRGEQYSSSNHLVLNNDDTITDKA